MDTAPMDTSAAPARSTGSWVFKWLGVLWGACIAISLVKRGFAIELQGLPLAIYEQYAWMRDTLLWPVVQLFKWFGWSIPVWVKDVMMGYGLVAGAHWKAEQELRNDGFDERQRIELSKDRNLSRFDKYFFRLRLGAFASTAWPLFWAYLVAARARTDFLRRNRQYKGWIVDPWIYDKLAKTVPRLVAVNMLLIALVAAIFFLWNHLQNVLGPIPG